MSETSLNRAGGRFLLTQATAISRDGRRLLGVESSGPGLAGHRVLSVDTSTGAVGDVGVAGYWAGAGAEPSGVGSLPGHQPPG